MVTTPHLPATYAGVRSTRLERPVETAPRRVSVSVREGVAMHTLMINMRHEVFSHDVVRQAIALTIDRDELNEVGWYGHATPTRSIFPPRFGFACAEQEPDADAARTLLDLAGWRLNERGVRQQGEHELRSILIVDQSQADLVAMAKDLRKQLRRIGIIVDVRLARRPRVLLRQRDWALALDSTSSLTSGNYGAIADRFLMMETGENLAGYASPVLDDLLPALLIERDDLRRRDLAQAIQDQIVEDAVLIPLLVPPRISKMDLLRILTPDAEESPLERLA